VPGMTADEARACFARARVARLATADAAGSPHLVPVVFAVSGDTVVFAVDNKPKRTTRLKRLANIRANPAACLLVDAYSEDWHQLWWARADGRAAELPPPERSEVSAGYVRLLSAKYQAQYGDRPPRGPVVSVDVSRWTGWRAAD
jgi:PPOX class probable F420-dependent enzyme